MSASLVEMRNITKKFPGVTANDDVTLVVNEGTIHALLGENGSGKSTLMSVLCGLYQPTSGEIYINGERKSFVSPKDAISCGIGMVHQHFKLIDTFTVLENVLLGKKNMGLLLDSDQIAEEFLALANKYEFQINLDAYVWQLSVGEKQQLEILRTLYYGAKVLILDEPTAVLTPQETVNLFVNLHKMARDGCAIIFITHKLLDVISLADEVTVLRGGKVSGHVTNKNLNREDLAKMMVGREIIEKYEKPNTPLGDTVLALKEIFAYNDMGSWGLTGLNLNVRAGEIYCIAGVSGNGQRELAEVIAGIRPLSKGTITIGDELIKKTTPLEMIDRGVSYVPEDRLGMGLIPDMDSCENLILKAYKSKRYAEKIFLKVPVIEHDTKDIVDKYNVKQAGIFKPVKMMSGGNLQKLLLAREIREEPRVMVVSYPSRGLDVGAIESVHRLLIGLKEKMTALVIISEDLEEIIKLADRVGVIYGGKILGEFPAGSIEIDDIGLLMAGITPAGKEETVCR